MHALPRFCCKRNVEKSSGTPERLAQKNSGLPARVVDVERREDKKLTPDDGPKFANAWMHQSHKDPDQNGQTKWDGIVVYTEMKF